MKKKYNRTFEFGKVAYTGKNKTNLVCLNVSLEIDGKREIFSASGEVWNHLHTDIYMGGQCIDDIYKEYKNEIKNRKLYESIMTLWGRWHLNDMHAECVHQEKKKQTWKKNPGIECLQCGWKLGHGWSYRTIDSGDLEEIMRILNINIVEKN